MGVTIYDIADQARVSIATVSRVFNNHARVSARTRARVLEVAEELGYQPHASAQSLARRQTSLVSAVIPMLANHFYLEVLRGLQDQLAESDFDLLVFSARQIEEVDAQLERALHRGRSAGVLLFSTPLTPDRTQRLLDSGQPVVLVDSFDSQFDSVSIDNEQGGYLATHALIERGFRRIGLLMAHADSVPASMRRAGYEKALREAGLSVDERLVATSGDEREHGFTEEAGYQGMTTLLGRHPRPDAVFVTSDVQALGALQAAREAGLRVPEDVALVGFDDVAVSRHVGLSTLRQPMYEMGKLAVDKLLLRIQHPEHPTSHTVFAPRFVDRRTSGVIEAEIIQTAAR